MSQTLTLYRLQQTDSQIDRLQNRLQAVRRLLEDDLSLRQTNEQARKAEEDFAACKRLLHQLEHAVHDQRIKIEQAEANLYGGAVHHPKELQDLQNEVASLRRHLGTLEDRQLESMLAFEECEALCRSACEARDAAEQAWNAQNASLNQELGRLEKGCETLGTERAAIAASIPAASLAAYEQLRQQRRGVAVARVADNACDACGSQLTLAQVQAARSATEPGRCPSCGRILYGN
jgi:hypothetical protein